MYCPIERISLQFSFPNSCFSSATTECAPFRPDSAFGLALLAVFGAQMLRNASADRFRSPVSGHLRLHVFHRESRAGHRKSLGACRQPGQVAQAEAPHEEIVPGRITLCWHRRSRAHRRNGSKRAPQNDRTAEFQRDAINVCGRNGV